MAIARIFPSRTSATPNDELAFTDIPGLFPPEVNEVNVSVTFSWDIPKAEYLAQEWGRIFPVRIGGPAYGVQSGEFIPGKYLKYGNVITSRGCPNRCWFCSVWKHEPKLIELPIRDGWILHDDNLLSCSEAHVRAVFAMLKRQPERATINSLEAARLKQWHVNLIIGVKPKQVFFAYDTADDYEPLVYAMELMKDAGFDRHTVRCYVLIGYRGDTMDLAKKRLSDVVNLGAFPMAMLYRDGKSEPSQEWRRFQRLWARPALIYKQMGGGKP
jgi:hypothetical protein